jgi:beta-glucosidase
MAPFTPLDGLLIGTATAAVQIEGGDRNNNWYDWSSVPGTSPTAPPRSGPPGTGNRWREDTELMASLGIQTYRFGVEWARLEPQPGVFSDEAFARYRDEIELLRDKGIVPLLTLHHFNNPSWFESMGAFERPDVVPTSSCASSSGWSPSSATSSRTGARSTNPTSMHVRLPLRGGSTRAKSLPRGAKSDDQPRARPHHGIRADPRPARPSRRRSLSPTTCGSSTRANPANPIHQALARVQEFLFQTAVTEAMCTGRFGRCRCAAPRASRAGPLLRRARHQLLLPDRGERIASMTGPSRTRPSTTSAGRSTPRAWSASPVGCTTATRARSGSPRTAPPTTATAHSARATSTTTCAPSPRSGLPFERYYHWCFVDNWEWAEGEVPRFGIVHLDYATQERTVKDSGRFLAAVIAEGGPADGSRGLGPASSWSLPDW